MKKLPSPPCRMSKVIQLQLLEQLQQGVIRRLCNKLEIQLLLQSCMPQPCQTCTTAPSKQPDASQTSKLVFACLQGASQAFLISTCGDACSVMQLPIVIMLLSLTDGSAKLENQSCASMLSYHLVEVWTFSNTRSIAGQTHQLSEQG